MDRSKCRPEIELLEDRVAPAVYAVGAGLAFPTINSVPWANLQPGDVVQIHWQPAPYHEKVMFSASGTAQAPIIVEGIPGPQGQLPVLDGANASTQSTALYPYAATQDRGLFIVTIDKTQPWGYIPSYIDIENLQFQNAYPGVSYTDYQGNVRTYSTNAAGIFVERGQDITIENCTLTGDANGLFVASGNEAAQLSQNITVEGCSLYGNGVVGSDEEHDAYTECLNIVYQYNDFGTLRPGAMGSALKDRSAGTVIRYNYIEPGAHLLDLVDAEDAPTLIGQNPAYRATYVYGNILVDPDGVSTLLVHYGGDSGVVSDYRQGTLYFYDNTVVVQCDQQYSWRTVLLELDSNAESADVWNNLIFDASTTPGQPATRLELMDIYGVGNFGTNWLSPGWLPSYDGKAFQGTLSGTNSFVVDPANNPNFVNLAGGDYHLAAGSSGIPSPSAIARALSFSTAYPATEQYVYVQSEQPRPGGGFGAFGVGGVSSTSPVTLAVSATNAVAGAAQVITVTAINSSGQKVTNYTGTVQFSSTDPDAVLPEDYTFTAADNGVHTFMITLKTEWSQRISVVDTANSGISGSATVEITPGAPAQLAVTAPATTTAGTPFNVTVAVEDAYGNSITNYTGGIRFGSSDQSSTLPGNYTFAWSVGGVCTFYNGVVFRTPGVQTLRVTSAGGLSGTAAVVVNAGATHFELIAPPTATPGSTVGVTVVALDEYGSVDPDYAGTIYFSCSNRTASLPAKYTFTSADHGEHTFTITLPSTGWQGITATDLNDSSLMGATSITVAAPTATSTGTGSAYRA